MLVVLSKSMVPLLLACWMACFAAAGAQILDCTPPTLPASATDSEPVRDAVKVAFHENTEQDLCHLQSPAFDDAKMAEYCEAFCATAGLTSGLPLQLGAEQYGFNLDEMTEVCSTVMTFNSSLERFCAARTESGHEIEEATAQLVAKVEIFKAEQTAFRAAMQHAAAELQEELASQEFQTEIDRAVDKIPVLRQKFNDFAEQQKGSAELQSAITSLRQWGDRLATIVNNNLGRFEEFLTDCNKMLLATGSKQEFLLDICAQTNVACIENSAAGHVGCCCGFNPVVAPDFDIDGIEASIFGGQGSVANGRRLQNGGTSEVNICAEARAASSAAVAAARQRTLALGQDALWAAQEAELTAAYGEYIEQCSSSPIGRRLEGAARSRAGEAKAAKAAAKVEAATASLTGAPLPLAQEAEAAEPRQLDVLSCTPPAPGETGLKVAFSNTTEEDMCHLQEAALANPEMREQCTRFCAGYGVSMLIGSQTYGFNLQVAENICLPPNGVLKHDPEKLQQCGSWSGAFLEIEVKTSQFISQLDIFTATRQLYVSWLRNVTQELQEFVASEQFAVDISRAIDKVSTLREAVRARVESARIQEAESTLRTSIATLKDRANALATVLNQNMALFERYLTECNDMYVGEGSQAEYLLDICAQQNSACIENEAAGHVSCCCAYHPFTTFGHPAPPHVIDGISEFESPARVSAVSGRRLTAADEGSQLLDICAQAWTSSQRRVQRLYSRIQETGFPEVIAERNRLMRMKYGDDFCAFEAGGNLDGSYYDYYSTNAPGPGPTPPPHGGTGDGSAQGPDGGDGEVTEEHVPITEAASCHGGSTISALVLAAVTAVGLAARQL